MTQQMEDRTRLKRHWVDQAISLAMQSKWAEAEKVNRQILELFPRDVDALNRLGRALSELARYADARQAYARAHEIDPSNTIAEKNLAKLSALQAQEHTHVLHERDRVDPRLFIAEAGKAGVTNLLRPAPKEVLAKMSIGDQARLQIEGRALLVVNSLGERLGQVEPRLSQRLIDFVNAGNRYSAAIVSLDESSVRVIITETYQHPSQAGKVAFPSKGADENSVKAYIRDSLIRYEDEDEEEELHEEADYALELDSEGIGAEPVNEPDFSDDDDLDRDN